MMADRELLEMAAKAAGIQLNNAAMQTMYMGDDGQWVFWNPLTDDGDALRLAVKLQLLVDCASLCARPIMDSLGWFDGGVGDDNEVMRRSIVMAAAEIGK